MTHDGHYIELDSTGSTFVLQSGTQKHKTATTADKLTTILPLVCLGHAFLKTSWAGTWLMLLHLLDGMTTGTTSSLPAAGLFRTTRPVVEAANDFG